ncbi:MAG: NADPH-dependent oxidoreductase [Acidobacteria bacterium]|nr:MAG: NADPH-dependent oxidoreductase [Acidobacteriota bacterium]
MRIVAIPGSLRDGSYNRMALRVAAQGARAAGAEVVEVSLRELALPVYDGDLEARDGLPEGARRLKALLLGSHGVLLASPEYNGGIPGGLKNALDWASRAEKGEKAAEAFRGKVAAILGASTGAFGAVRSLAALRPVLAALGLTVLGDQVALPRAQDLFAPDGSLADEGRKKALLALGAGLARAAERAGG